MANQLHALLYTTLRKEIGGSNCVLLDLPNYYNPGDQLIWEGEEQLLRQLKVKVSYRASLHFFNPNMIKAGDCILLQGGGNFGDLYYKHQQFREYIVEQFPSNKIIILPVTIHFSSMQKLIQSFAILRGHPNLIICGRDQKSYDLLQKYFYASHCVLLPDTANAITNMRKYASNNQSGNVLFLSRTDTEKSTDQIDMEWSFRGSLKRSDWPQFVKRNLVFHYVILRINILLLRILQLFGAHWDSRHDIYGLIKVQSREQQVKEAQSLLSGFDLVITSRLHGHILAGLLGIPSIVLDNSYGKNQDYYTTWSKNYDHKSHYAKNLKEVELILNTQDLI
jgi:exopolysaccharide biosynthesis predicted pyruvyltransferase EpsI